MIDTLLKKTSRNIFTTLLKCVSMSLWKTGCMDQHNRGKVYLCTQLVQWVPGTMFTKMEKKEEEEEEKGTKQG